MPLGPHASLTSYAWLSIATALATMALKGAAAWMTGSVGLLSDALESSVNLMAAIVALAMIRLAQRPPNERHPFGFGKAEYFSSGFEGALILIAAIAIIATAIERLISPQPLERLDLGLLLSFLATALNWWIARSLIRTGIARRSIALEADGHHLMTDVITSVGVAVAMLAVLLTGWQWLDPLIAIAVAINILWIGYKLILRSALALMDRTIGTQERAALETILERYRRDRIGFGALRSREAGGRSFISMHVMVPGAWTVQQGHDLLEKIERDIREAIPKSVVFTHMEPAEDPRSLADDVLDR